MILECLCIAIIAFNILRSIMRSKKFKWFVYYNYQRDRIDPIISSISAMQRDINIINSKIEELKIDYDVSFQKKTNDHLEQLNNDIQFFRDMYAKNFDNSN